MSQQPSENRQDTKPDAELTLAYHSAGPQNMKRVPIVFLHGVGLNKACWLHQTEPLSKVFVLFAPDLPGHGDSPLWLHPATARLVDYTVEIARFCEQMIGRPAIIVGHSLGALIALDLARRYPALCAGVMPLSAIYRRSAAAQNLVKTRAAQLTRMKDTESPDEIISAPLSRWFDTQPGSEEAPLAALCGSWLAAANPQGYATAYRVFAEEDGPDERVLKGLKIPTVFVTGGADPNSSPEMSHRMAALTPQAEVKIINGARHMLQLTHAREVTRAIEAFAHKL